MRHLLRFTSVLPALATLVALDGCVVTPAATSQSRGTVAGPATNAEPGPIACSGNHEVVLDACVIDAPEVAIDAHGNCRVLLTNCTIRAGRLAIDAHGNANVTIRGGTIDAPAAVDARGNAAVVLEGVATTGTIDRHGNASVDVR